MCKGVPFASAGGSTDHHQVSGVHGVHGMCGRVSGREGIGLRGAEEEVRSGVGGGSWDRGDLPGDGELRQAHASLEH